jgi:long-chain acyl-CoA synthetase
MVLVGGLNVYPREIEDVLYSHPKVLQAAVVGVPDKLRGEAVKAFIVLKPGQTCSAKEIRTFCRERLAVFKVPRHVEFRDELPMSNTGKVLKRELRG